jgi:phosphohistidine phosphatase
MNLYLVQHGEAKFKTEDPTRSLTAKGRAETSKVISYLVERVSLPIHQIIHSGKTRAKQTADVLAQALHPPEGVAEAQGLAPLDEPSIWARRLAEQDQNLMLVGHLPHLSKLAALLLCGDEDQKIVAFQNSGVVCLVQDEEGVWAVHWIVTPDISG